MSRMMSGTAKNVKIGRSGKNHARARLSLVAVFSPPCEAPVRHSLRDDSMASEAVSVALQVGDEPCASLLSCMMELNVPCHHPKAP